MPEPRSLGFRVQGSEGRQITKELSALLGYHNARSLSLAFDGGEIDEPHMMHERRGCAHRLYARST